MKEESAVEAPAAEEVEVSILHLAATVIRRRYLVAALGLVGLLLALALTLLPPSVFVATASFVPQGATSSQRSQIAGLVAGQLGVDIGGGASAESPAFYADLLVSREILQAVAQEEFSFWHHDSPTDSTLVQGTLPELLGFGEGGGSQERRIARAVRWLSTESIGTAVSATTGVVTLRVRAPWPGLAEAITSKLLDLVNSFNLDVRRSQAAAERQFVEERLEEAQDSLRLAENRLQAFLQGNRDFQNSPQLIFQHDRLQRAVVLQQQIFTSLAQSFEQARISEVRDIPVITVIESPEQPLGPQSRRLLPKAALGVFLGLVAGVLAALVLEYLSHSKAKDPEDFAELRSAWRDALGDVRGVGGRVAAPLRSRSGETVDEQT